jgi:hypothetical protein
MKKVIGFVLLLMFFIGLFWYLISVTSLVDVLWGVGVAFCVTVFVYFCVWLITSE